VPGDGLAVMPSAGRGYVDSSFDGPITEADAFDEDTEEAGRFRS